METTADKTPPGGRRSRPWAAGREASVPTRVQPHLGFSWLCLAFLGLRVARKPRKDRPTGEKAKSEFGFSWLSDSPAVPATPERSRRTTRHSGGCRPESGRSAAMASGNALDHGVLLEQNKKIFKCNFSARVPSRIASCAGAAAGETEAPTKSRLEIRLNGVNAMQPLELGPRPENGRGSG